MHDEIHVVVDSISAADETALKDDQRCHILRLIIRHGDLEWQDGDRSLAELFGMVEATGKLPITSQPHQACSGRQKGYYADSRQRTQRYLSDRLRCCASGNG